MLTENKAEDLHCMKNKTQCIAFILLKLVNNFHVKKMLHQHNLLLFSLSLITSGIQRGDGIYFIHMEIMYIFKSSEFAAATSNPH